MGKWKLRNLILWDRQVLYARTHTQTYTQIPPSVFCLVIFQFSSNLWRYHLILLKEERKETNLIKNHQHPVCFWKDQWSTLLLETEATSVGPGAVGSLWPKLPSNWETRSHGTRWLYVSRAKTPSFWTQHSCTCDSHHCQRGCRTLIITGKEITQYSLMRRLLWEFDCIMKMLLWKVLPIVLRLRLASLKKSVTCFDRLLRKILCLLH